MAAQKGVTDLELKALIQAKIQNSTGYEGGTLAAKRVEALRYYNGDKFGNEVDGRSQVVMRDVSQAIDAAMPSLIKIFCGSDEAVVFEPNRPDQEDGAAQATDYINYLWRTDPNNSIETCYTWFKDALLYNVGIIKIWWDTKTEARTEKYKRMTDAELVELLSDEDVEVVDHEEYPDPSVPLPMKIMGMMSNQPQPLLHDVTVTVTNEFGRVMVRPVPSDEFLIDRRAVSLDEIPFCAHRTRMTVSDLIDLGYEWDEVEPISGNVEADYTLERIERFKQEDEQPFRRTSDMDPSMREVWITECYIRVDRNGDGIAEMKKITVGGQANITILDEEDIDDHPFASLCPFPMPHKFFGEGIYDKLWDIQLIRSTLLRGALDNLYLTNNPQKEVVDGQVNMDDLLSPRPGNIVRVNAPGMINDLAIPFVAENVLPYLQYFDEVKQERAGISSQTGELDGDIINSSATGANIQNNAKMERIELIARVFAETGVKRAFKRMLQLVCQYQQKARTIKLRGKWVDMDPREWETGYDVKIKVGLGTGSKDQVLQHLMAITQPLQGIIQLQGGAHGPIVTMENIYEYTKQLMQAAGLPAIETLLTDPANAPPQQQQPPPPDPKAIAAQAQTQIAAQKAQADMALDNQRFQHQQQMDQVKLAHDQALQKMRIDGDMQIQSVKAANELHLANVRAQSDMAINEQQAKLSAEKNVGEV